MYLTPTLPWQEIIIFLLLIRNIRRDYIDKVKALKKSSEITEDELKTVEKEIQDATDKSCNEIDKLVKNKEAEVMSI